MLEIRDLHISFGDKHVIRGFSTSIPNGKIGVLLGRSGSGKSTILKMITGMLNPDYGEILVDGINIVGTPISKRGLGFVPQHQLLFPGLNVFENLAYGLKSQKWGREEIKRRVSEIAELVGVDHLLRRHPRNLSGGERQRVALGRALATYPKILLMDEPFSSLDESERKKLALVFRQIQQELGITSVHVTHSSQEAALLSDKIVVLENGVVVQEGNYREVRRFPKSKTVAKLMGIPNILENESQEIIKAWKLEPKGEEEKFFQVNPWELKRGNMGIECKVIAVTEGIAFLYTDGNFLSMIDDSGLNVGQKIKVERHPEKEEIGKVSQMQSRVGKF